MKTALVLGGTLFFGKHLVQQLLAQGVDVTIATRGRQQDPFGDRVQRLAVNRLDKDALRQAIGDRTFDVVFDNICYTPQEALDACEIFAGKVGRYVFTSTMSVYDFSDTAWTEEGFDPHTYPIKMGGRGDFDYKEGKRQAEAVFYQKAEFPVNAVRFPIVLGTDDYTKRLLFHIEHVRSEQEFIMPNPDATMVFITSEEAGKLLAWVATSELEGPVNACSHGTIKLRELIGLIEDVVGKQAIISTDAGEGVDILKPKNEHHSPYGIPQSWYLDASKAAQAGFPFFTLREYLPDLIRDLHEQK